METNYIGLLIGFFFCIWLSQFSISKQDLTAISLIGWAVYIIFNKGGM